MKFGVIETLDAGPARGPGDRLRRLARAEEQGYRAAWIRAAGDSTRASDAGRSLFAASWLAARTESISVGLWAPLPPDLHPLRLAEDLAVLDLLSGGRLEWAPGGEAFSESLEIVLRAWSGEAFSHAGERFEFSELQCTPRPAQRPHPRLWLAPGVAPPPLAHADHWGRIEEFTAERERANPLGEESASHRPRVLVYPALEGDGPQSSRWIEELAQLRRRFDPDWVLVWPGGGLADEEGAARIQQLFVSEVAPACQGSSISA